MTSSITKTKKIGIKAFAYKLFLGLFTLNINMVNAQIIDTLPGFTTLSSYFVAAQSNAADQTFAANGKIYFLYKVGNQQKLFVSDNSSVVEIIAPAGKNLTAPFFVIGSNFYCAVYTIAAGASYTNLAKVVGTTVTEIANPNSTGSFSFPTVEKLKPFVHNNVAHLQYEDGGTVFSRRGFHCSFDGTNFQIYTKPTNHHCEGNFMVFQDSIFSSYVYDAGSYISHRLCKTLGINDVLVEAPDVATGEGYYYSSFYGGTHAVVNNALYIPYNDANKIHRIARYQNGALSYLPLMAGQTNLTNQKMLAPFVNYHDTLYFAYSNGTGGSLGRIQSDTIFPVPGSSGYNTKPLIWNNKFIYGGSNSPQRWNVYENGQFSSINYPTGYDNYGLSFPEKVVFKGDLYYIAVNNYKYYLIKYDGTTSTVFANPTSANETGAYNGLVVNGDALTMRYRSSFTPSSDGMSPNIIKYKFAQLNIPCIAPAITTQPNNLTACLGKTDSLKVSYSGTSQSLQWYKNGTAIAGAINKNLVFTNASLTDAGTYYLIISASCGTVTTNSVTVNVNNTPAAPTASAQAFCAAQLVSNLNANGTALSWYSVATRGSALTPTTQINSTNIYYVTQTTNGCESARTSVSVTINAAPSVTVNSGLICNGNSFTLTPSGAATYTYSSGSAIVTPTINSTYTVSVTGTNGCQNTAVSTITVTQVTSTVAQTNILCNGASLATATVTAANGTSSYSYTWSPSGGNTNVASSLVAGTYSCLIADANNCTTTQTVVITEPTPLNIAVASSSILCIGGVSTVSVSATGGVSPYTNTGSYTVSAGNYSYTVTDNNGCTKSSTITVAEPSLLTSSLTASTILCYGNLASVVVTGNGGTLPYTGAGSFSVAANNYTYVVTDANGCTAASTVIITQPTIIQSAQTVTLCAGSSLVVGTNTYTTSGFYTDVLAASNGCDSTVTTNLTVYPQVTNTQTFTICAGQSFNVGSSNYTTSGTYTNTTVTTNGCTINIITNLIVRPAIVNNQIVTICANQNYVIGTSIYSIAATYSNVFTAANGCDSTVRTNLIVKPISFKTQNISICGGQSYTIGTSNYTTAGTYTNVLQSANTCDSIVVTHLFVNPLPNVTVNSGEICFGNSFSLTASGANTYNYSNGNNVTPTQTTTYTVIGTSINGCSNQAISTVSVNTLPTIELGDDVTIILGESHMFTPQLNNVVTYTWTSANGLDNIFIANATSSAQTNTTYTLTVTSAKGCVASDVVNVIIYDEFFISNFMSPNGDGDNDTWKASVPYLIKDFALDIVDQWGNKVFSVPNNYSNNWDATNNGNAVPDGVYYYIFSEAGKVKYTGSITVLR